MQSAAGMRMRRRAYETQELIPTDTRRRLGR